MTATTRDATVTLSGDSRYAGRLDHWRWPCNDFAMRLGTRRTIGIFIVLLASIHAALADLPATAPSTTATAVGSPKSALKAYNLAMRNADVPGMMALQHAVTDDELHLARCNTQSDLQVAALEQAARDRFGDAGAKQVASAIGDEDDAAVDAAKETINGERAEVQFAGSDSPVPMIRNGDRWTVDVQANLRDAGGSAEEMCDQTIRRGSAAKVTAQEITAGQFKTVAAAVEALKSRLKES